MILIADKIKQLRQQNNLTQTDLAKKLSITRSSVNAWEMGISVPSTQYIIELSSIFKVSTDYLLGMESTSSISVAGLEDTDVNIVQNLISHLRNKNKKKQD